MSAPSCPHCGAELRATPSEPPLIDWPFANQLTWERVGDWYCQTCKACQGIARTFTNEQLTPKPDYEI